MQNCQELSIKVIYNGAHDSTNRKQVVCSKEAFFLFLILWKFKIVIRNRFENVVFFVGSLISCHALDKQAN